MPNNISDVLRRAKEIRFASRVKTCIGLEQELHRLRHYLSMLAERLPEDEKCRPEISEMLSYGCRSVFHLVRLQAPKPQNKKLDKDIDFAPERVGLRWSAGCQDALRALADQAWMMPIEFATGIVIHDHANDAPDPVSPRSDTGVTQTRRRTKRRSVQTAIEGGLTHGTH